MISPSNLKDIRWQGDSRKVAHRFPKGARVALGKELTRIQMGLQPRNGKWLTGIGSGVQEIRIAYSKEAYRVIYVATLGDSIFVLHAFTRSQRRASPRRRRSLTLRPSVIETS